jgi:hypothetical protein
MFDETHLRELAAGHTFEYKGVRYQTALDRARFDPNHPGVDPRSVYLQFSATPNDGDLVLRPALNVGIDRAEDDEFVLGELDNTIKKIADGELPPGTIDYL